uniref:Uncharacterized protein n=1 Tax=Chromera velia CCMP2878 TaxID=1169474 RepID=A0A0G4HYM5_9ALVE|eukprot:Cvel_33659.t1-p1 / transcript=Cvel_33659.t1 / gene=Cvel_33659 / organism=Chromera_velia_CCMP2878 / gene_product=hypothetical protein / transcript_product=hypothetical protein / location=Cvel_scaffold5529:1565-2428(-) / protein_length=139 / sequence_SO=supercontig / SO=protein_coding / is_pseudo=false
MERLPEVSRSVTVAELEAASSPVSQSLMKKALAMTPPKHHSEMGHDLRLLVERSRSGAFREVAKGSQDAHRQQLEQIVERQRQTLEDQGPAERECQTQPPNMSGQETSVEAAELAAAVAIAEETVAGHLAAQVQHQNQR